jgi:hypothetical protein
MQCAPSEKALVRLFHAKRCSSLSRRWSIQFGVSLSGLKVHRGKKLMHDEDHVAHLLCRKHHVSPAEDDLLGRNPLQFVLEYCIERSTVGLFRQRVIRRSDCLEAAQEPFRRVWIVLKGSRGNDPKHRKGVGSAVLKLPDQNIHRLLLFVCALKQLSADEAEAHQD